MLVSKNFQLKEFIHPGIYALWGDFSIRFIDNRLIDLVQVIRDRFGVPFVINGMFRGALFTESGLRSFGTKTGAGMSQHKFGRAVDLKCSAISPDEIRSEIRKNYEFFRSYGLTAIEVDTPTWVHISTENTGSGALVEIPYK